MTKESNTPPFASAVWNSLRASLKAVNADLAEKLDADMDRMTRYAPFPLIVLFRFYAALILVRILDVPDGGSGSIVPLPSHITNLIRASNRIVSFILDGTVHFATGVLVGPCHVLTTAHPFFDDGVLIDRRKLGRITVEVHTTFLDRALLMEAGIRTAKLVNVHDVQSNEWLIDPVLIDDVAQRELELLDFIIVKIDEEFGADPIGLSETRRWFEIPTAAAAPILRDETPIRVLQFLNRGPLRGSSGHVRSVTSDGLRILHTASTEDSASGSAIVDDDLCLVALHLSGAASGEFPISNRGLPIRRIAETIDERLGGRLTIRSLLC